jgi:hypothetical protein
VRIADASLDLAHELLELARRDHVWVKAHLVGGVGRANVDHAVGAPFAERGHDRHRAEVRLEAHLFGDLNEQVLVRTPAVA